MSNEQKALARVPAIQQEFASEFEQLRCCDNGEPLALVIARLQLRIEELEDEASNLRRQLDAAWDAL